MGETYLARGACKNCGYRNYPQWGEYEVGKKISDYPCPKCGCDTWSKDELVVEDSQ
jgi:predicted nucleic-acid-binding Zn-ribbon protein